MLKGLMLTNWLILWNKIMVFSKTLGIKTNLTFWNRTANVYDVLTLSFTHNFKTC